MADLNPIAKRIHNVSPNPVRLTLADGTSAVYRMRSTQFFQREFQGEGERVDDVAEQGSVGRETASRDVDETRSASSANRNAERSGDVPNSQSEFAGSKDASRLSNVDETRSVSSANRNAERSGDVDEYRLITTDDNESVLLGRKGADESEWSMVGEVVEATRADEGDG
jgi:hypothetical protein